MKAPHKHSRSLHDSITHPLDGLPSRQCFSKRCRVLSFLFAAFWLLVLFYARRPPATAPLSSYWKDLEDSFTSFRLPPLYEAYHDYERHLPQHNLSLPYPEGRDAKFFWVAGHVKASGWGNAMQELLVNTLLSHTTNRAFVFDNYTWSQEPPEYSNYHGKLIPSRIPLTAIMSGPVIGASWPPGDPVPRSVSREYFERVCPNPVVLDALEINEHLRMDANVPASVIFDKWVDKLNSISDPCVEISRQSFQIFEIWLFGSKRILSLWPRLSQSPVLRDFSWSPLVLRAFAQNAELLGALSSPSFRFLSPHLRPSVSPPLAPTELHNVEPLLKPEQTDPIPGLLVLHIRRGDFADHCLNLAKWSSDWNGLNQFSTLPDKFRVPPPSGGWGETTEQNIQIYMQHCFPTVEQITDKVREVLQDQYKSPRSTHELKRVYVMSNGDEAWLRKLKEALLEIKRWDAVVTSRDLRLSWEAKPIAQAVDMLIGQRAQVFIGNGFSSLTSNIVMFRMLRELPPEDTRFW